MFFFFFLCILSLSLSPSSFLFSPWCYSLTALFKLIISACIHCDLNCSCKAKIVNSEVTNNSSVLLMFKFLLYFCWISFSYSSILMIFHIYLILRLYQLYECISDDKCEICMHLIIDFSGISWEVEAPRRKHVSKNLKFCTHTHMPFLSPLGECAIEFLFSPKRF